MSPKLKLFIIFFLILLLEIPLLNILQSQIWPFLSQKSLVPDLLFNFSLALVLHLSSWQSLASLFLIAGIKSASLGGSIGIITASFLSLWIAVEIIKRNTYLPRYARKWWLWLLTYLVYSLTIQAMLWLRDPRQIYFHWSWLYVSLLTYFFHFPQRWLDHLWITWWLQRKKTLET
jgi:hypothetical protein